MTHDLVIIISKLATMRGNATSGFMFDLHAVVVAAKDILDNGEPANAEAIHEQLEIIGAWVDDQYGCIPTMTADLEAML